LRKDRCFQRYSASIKLALLTSTSDQVCKQISADLFNVSREIQEIIAAEADFLVETNPRGKESIGRTAILGPPEQVKRWRARLTIIAALMLRRTTEQNSTYKA
jgi:hypothetical protein